MQYTNYVLCCRQQQHCTEVARGTVAHDGSTKRVLEIKRNFIISELLNSSRLHLHDI